MSSRGQVPEFPVIKSVSRAEVVAAIDGAIKAARRFTPEQAAKLLTVATDAERIGVGSASVVGNGGVRVGCPLMQAGLWDEDDTVSANAQWRFYRTFDNTMGPGFCLIEVED